jgi:hypothetical protein
MVNTAAVPATFDTRRLENVVDRFVDASNFHNVNRRSGNGDVTGDAMSDIYRNFSRDIGVAEYLDGVRTQNGHQENAIMMSLLNSTVRESDRD